MPRPREWLRLSELPIEALGVSRRTVQRWCRAGRIRCRFKKQRFEIHVRDLLAVKQREAGLDP